jgi:hypothetical protein
LTKSRPHVRVAVRGDAAMLDGAVLRVGRLLEASTTEGLYAFEPHDAICALRALHDRRREFSEAAHEAIKNFKGAKLLSAEEASVELRGAKLDVASRAPTLVPIYAFDEDVVRYEGFVIRLQVAVTVCERPGKDIVRSKAWVRCKRVGEPSKGDLKKELRAFREASVKLAKVIINRQVGVYRDALKTVVREDLQASFNVHPSNELFTILGLPSDELDNFQDLFGEVLGPTPLQELAAWWSQKKDARALWNLLDLLPGELKSEKKLAELERKRRLQLRPFQNSESFRGIFLWYFDHNEAEPRVDVVGFAAPPPWELDSRRKDGAQDAHRRAVNSVTASISADLGQAV